MTCSDSRNRCLKLLCELQRLQIQREIEIEIDMETQIRDSDYF